jgi:hypothetical protein
LAGQQHDQQRAGIAECLLLSGKRQTFDFGRLLHDLVGKLIEPLLKRAIQKQIRKERHRRDRQEADRDEINK